MSGVDKLFVELMHETSRLPTKGSAHSAGYDLYASCSGVISANTHGVVSCGIKIKMPENVYGRIASRSGLSVRNGIEVGAGVIDNDYQGEILVVLYNHSNDDFEYTEGMRIAQLILEKYTSADIVQVKKITELGITERSEGGFGSTGM